MDAARTKGNETAALTLAVQYIRAGISVIPIALDGSKAPAAILLPEVQDGDRYKRSWVPFQQRLPTETELRRWFGGTSPAGIAAVCGAISGNLEVIDFDDLDHWPLFTEALEGAAPSLLAQLTQIKTPGGWHLWYRCAGKIGGNTKLATDPARQKQTLVETRGEGGYALVPGCPPACHETVRTYQHAGGPPLCNVATVSVAERQLLLSISRAFDRSARPQTAGSAAAGGRPGDDFDQRGLAWADILEPHGWTRAGGSSAAEYWRRPGKARGWSATAGICQGPHGEPLLHVFSSNATPFEAGKTYGRFRAFALLQHAGDCSAAARELARQGFGAAPAPHRNGRQREPALPEGQRGGAWESPLTADSWEPPTPLLNTAAAEAFPLDTLPGNLARFVEAVGLAKGCPPDYAAVPLLTLAGAAIGASRALEIKPGWRERPCLYAAVIGPPGSAKTPALKAVAAPVYSEQFRRLANYRRQRLAWEEAEKEDKGELPKLETVFVSDVTLEKLACILQDNPRGVALIRDELTGWIASMDQYRAKGRGADRQAFLSIWAGEPIRVDRKGPSRASKVEPEPEPIYVPYPFVGIIGGLPPDLLPRLRGEQEIWDGFLDRVLLSFPEPLPAKGEDWLCIEPETMAAWEGTLQFLWDLQPEQTQDFENRPRPLRLTADARRAWERFTSDLAGEQNREDLADAFKGHLAKFQGYCARLALILHLLRLACRETDAEDLDGESIERASRLIGYFRSHCFKVHAALASDPAIENARRVLAWIERERPAEFKRYEVFEDVKSKRQFARPEDLDKPLGRLERHRYIRRRERSQQGPGRPADPVFAVNPVLLGNHPKNPTNPVFG